MPLADFSDLLDRVEQGTAAEDVAALKQLAEAAPGHVTAHVALAHACEQAGRWNEARQSWQRAALLSPSSPAVHAGLRRTASRVSDGASSEEASDEEPAEGTEVPEREELSTPASAKKESEGREASPALGSKALQELVEAAPGDTDVGAHDHLDSLIEELEGARIEPSPDPTSVPTPDLDTGDSDVVSPTLARIYQAQGQYTEAARVYRRLAEQCASDDPIRADEHRRQAEAMQARADEEARSPEEGGAGERESG